MIAQDSQECAAPCHKIWQLITKQPELCFLQCVYWVWLRLSYSQQPCMTSSGTVWPYKYTCLVCYSPSKLSSQSCAVPCFGVWENFKFKDPLFKPSQHRPLCGFNTHSVFHTSVIFYLGFCGLKRCLKTTHPRGHFLFVCDIDGNHLHSPPRLLIQVVHLSQTERQTIRTTMLTIMLNQPTANRGYFVLAGAKFKSVLSPSQIRFKFKSKQVH